MDMLKPIMRWTVRSLSVAALAAAVQGGSAAAAQAPAGAPRPQAAEVKKTFTKNTVFNLPIHMDEKTRAGLDRVCLYVKAGNGEWVRHDSAPPTLPHFTYRVPQDGEYCFTLVTIDKSGRAVPADVNQEPPSLQVTVDTQAPIIEVQPWTAPDGEVCLRCRVNDANADLATLKGLVKSPSGEKLLLPYPGQPGVFKMANQDLAAGTAVLLAGDRAGNMATKEVKLQELFASPVQVAQAQTPKVEPPVAEARPMQLPLITEGPALPPIPPAPLPDIKEPTPLPPVTPPMLPPTLTATATPAPRPVETPLPQPSVVETTSARTALGAAKQLISTTHAVVDYRVDQVGPSGIGKVEVYITTDDGQNWQRVCEDQDRRSPVEFDLPGEGTYGIRLAITNGNGFGGTPPQRGDSPAFTIEVDASSPFVQLRPIEPVVANGALEIRWQATDKNLGKEPVNLYYRTASDGPWQVIARGIKNDGAYRWNFPRENAPQFFIKVEVTDLSGNIARAETSNPIVLDTTEPRATVVNVSGLSVRP